MREAPVVKVRASRAARERYSRDVEPLAFLVVWLDGDGVSVGSQWLEALDLSDALRWAAGRLERQPVAQGFYVKGRRRG